MFEMLHSGELYLPNDPSILIEQQKHLELLYDYNDHRIARTIVNSIVLAAKRKFGSE